MVDLRSKIGPVHAGKSRFSIKANHIELNMQQLMDIIQFSFSSGCFTTLGRCYRRVQGTSMGNKVSPILSSLSIVAYERAWLHDVQIFVQTSCSAVCGQSGNFHP